MKHLVEENEVISVPVPKSTKSYRAVSNAQIISLIKEHSQRLGYEISEKQYRMNRGGNQMSGLYKLETEDQEMSMMIGFYNSYDKSRRFGIGSGALVNICSNGLIMAEFVNMKKHMGNINEHLDFMIFDAIRNVKSQFEKAQEEKRFFQEKPIEHIEVIHKLIGEMYLTENLLAARQLSALSESIGDVSNHFHILKDGELVEGKTMWDMYNLVTESYKKEPAFEFVDKHVKFHKYMKSKFDEPTTTIVPEILTDF